MWSGASWAQHGPALGSIFLSMSPDEQVNSGAVTPLEPFEFYLVIDPEGRALSAYEVQVELDPSIAFMAVEFGNEHSLNFGGGFSDGIMPFIVGTGECLSGAPLLTVVTFRAMLLEEADSAWIRLNPVDPSSFNGEAPGWLECGPSLLHRFASWDLNSNALRLSTSTVATTSSSWGAVKALYDGG